MQHKITNIWFFKDWKIAKCRPVLQSWAGLGAKCINNIKDASGHSRLCYKDLISCHAAARKGEMCHKKMLLEILFVHNMCSQYLFIVIAALDFWHIHLIICHKYGLWAFQHKAVNWFYSLNLCVFWGENLIFSLHCRILIPLIKFLWNHSSQKPFSINLLKRPRTLQNALFSKLH